MKQGEIWLTNLNPTEGSEQSGFRPVIIVSGDALNDNAQVVWCCPLTTKLKKYLPEFQWTPLEDGLAKTCEWFQNNFQQLRK